MCSWIYTTKRCCYCNGESITDLAKLRCNLHTELVSFYNEINGPAPSVTDCPAGINLCLKQVVEEFCSRDVCKPTLSQRRGRGIMRLDRHISICAPLDANTKVILLVSGFEDVSPASLRDALHRRRRQRGVQQGPVR